MIKVNRTYATYTHESAEGGEYESSGFIQRGELMEWRELVELMRGGHASVYPVEASTHVWVDYSEDSDVFTGEVTIESVHYAGDSEWEARAWCRALKAAFSGKGRDKAKTYVFTLTRTYTTTIRIACESEEEAVKTFERMREDGSAYDEELHDVKISEDYKYTVLTNNN